MTNNGPFSLADWAMMISITAHFMAFGLAQKNKSDKQRLQIMNGPPPIWPSGFSPKGRAKHKTREEKVVIQMANPE